VAKLKRNLPAASNFSILISPDIHPASAIFSFEKQKTDANGMGAHYIHKLKDSSSLSR
jgi:hypothetical protein